MHAVFLQITLASVSSSTPPSALPCAAYLIFHPLALLQCDHQCATTVDRVDRGKLPSERRCIEHTIVYRSDELRRHGLRKVAFYKGSKLFQIIPSSLVLDGMSRNGAARALAPWHRHRAAKLK